MPSLRGVRSGGRWRRVYDGIVTAVAFAGDETAKVEPPSEVKELHDNLLADIDEFEQAVEDAGSGLDRTAGADAVEAVFPDVPASLTTPFCALQAVADEKGIEADVGCDWRRPRIRPPCPRKQPTRC